MASPDQLRAVLHELIDSPVSETVRRRMQQFRAVDDLFCELCFCTLTANTSAEKAIEVQQALGDDFCTLGQEQLRSRLKQAGYRFTNRAAYICQNRRYRDIGVILQRFGDAGEAREWLVEHIKGLGYKEASHFLRNIGYTDMAIIDRHVLRVMERHGLIDTIPASLSRQQYLAMEATLRDLADSLDITLAELDLYLWYMETGKILK
ncbi:MAG: N-glycosylase/DNA lyase [Thermoplasmatota archaeon]